MLDVLLDTALDCLKLLPFLFLTYLVLEFIEDKTADFTQKLVRRAGMWGPFAGSALGLLPQCGFSAAAADLYSQRLVSAGTLLAVFISTSDEMLPLLISESAPAALIAKVLATKFVAGIAVGLLVDRVLHLFPRDRGPVDVHAMCEKEGCGCEKHGVVVSALIHTGQIAFFIFIFTLALNTIIHFIGEDALKGLILNRPVLGPLLSAAVGLIPNCAASVIITELYLSGAMSTGALISGLATSAGIGLLVLFRTNREHPGENLKLLAVLYAAGAVIGIGMDALGIVF